MLNNKKELELQNVDFTLAVELLKLGLVEGCTLEEFDAAVIKKTSENFSNVWSQVYPVLSKKQNSEKPVSEVIAMDYVKDEMGWKSSTNLQAYVTGAKTIGLSNAKRLSQVLGCKASDIHPLVDNELLNDYLKSIKEAETNKKNEKNAIIASNLSDKWSEYKNKHPKVTQEEFCKENLSIKNQSNFSQMLKGRISFSKKRIEDLANAFGCSPIELDPDYSFELNSFSAKAINELISMLNTKNLTDIEKEQIKVISNAVM